MKAAASKPYLVALTSRAMDLGEELEDVANGEEDERIAEMTDDQRSTLIASINEVVFSAMRAVVHLKGGAK